MRDRDAQLLEARGLHRRAVRVHGRAEGPHRKHRRRRARPAARPVVPPPGDQVQRGALRGAARRRGGLLRRGSRRDREADRLLHGERHAHPRGTHRRPLRRLRRRARPVHLAAHARGHDVLGLLRPAPRADPRRGHARARASAPPARATSASPRSTPTRTSTWPSNASARPSPDPRLPPGAIARAFIGSPRPAPRRDLSTAALGLLRGLVCARRARGSDPGLGGHGGVLLRQPGRPSRHRPRRGLPLVGPGSDAGHAAPGQHPERHLLAPLPLLLPAADGARLRVLPRPGAGAAVELHVRPVPEVRGRAHSGALRRALVGDDRQRHDAPPARVRDRHPAVAARDPARLGGLPPQPGRAGAARRPGDARGGLPGVPVLRRPAPVRALQRPGDGHVDGARHRPDRAGRGGPGCRTRPWPRASR